MARKPKSLSRLVVDEISLVDRAANEGARVVYSKRNRPSRYEHLFRGLDLSKAALTSRVPSEDINNVDLDGKGNLDTEAKLSSGLEKYIQAMILANPKLTPQEAADHLLHSHDGRALARHAEVTKAAPEKETTMDFMTEMTAITKQQGGMTQIAKSIVEKGETSLTEAQFTQLLMAHAKLNKSANESDGAAFSRIFSAQSDEGLQIRKAHAITKNTLAPRLPDVDPVQVGGDDATNSDEDQSAAYEQLVAMANELMRLAPTLKFASVFSKVFTDPSNSALANRAHRRPTASTGYAHPV
jgi:hypothetical protein